VKPFLSLPPRPTTETATAVCQLGYDLRQLSGPRLPALSLETQDSKKVTDILGRYLKQNRPRTVVILDDNQLSPNSSIQEGEIVKFGPTTLVTVSRDDHLPAPSQVTNSVAIRGGTKALLNHEARTGALEGLADLVVAYHTGEDRDSHLNLARRLVTDTGLYVEVFDAPGLSGEIVTLYSPGDLKQVADSMGASRVSLVGRLSQWLGDAWQRFTSVHSNP